MGLRTLGAVLSLWALPTGCSIVAAEEEPSGPVLTRNAHGVPRTHLSLSADEPLARFRIHCENWVFHCPTEVTADADPETARAFHDWASTNGMLGAADCADGCRYQLPEFELHFGTSTARLQMATGQLAGSTGFRVFVNIQDTVPPGFSEGTLEWSWFAFQTKNQIVDDSPLMTPGFVLLRE
jgi:hypothetical protein